VDETVEALFLNQRSFLLEMPPTDLNPMDYTNYERDDVTGKRNILSGNGLHPILDFMNLSLTAPVQYFP
jgi:hypothetical protein